MLLLAACNAAPGSMTPGTMTPIQITQPAAAPPRQPTLTQSIDQSTPTPGPAAITPTQAREGVLSISHLLPGVALDLNQIEMINAYQGWASVFDERKDEHLLYTHDSGQTWLDVTPPEPASTARQDGKRLLAAFPDAQHAWVVYSTIDQDFGPVFNPQVWSTQDGGHSWELSEALDLGDWEGGYSQPRFLEFTDIHNGMLILGHDPGAGHAPLSVYHTSNGGLNWELERSAMDENGRAIDVCCQTGLAVASPQTALMTMDPGPMGFTYWNWSRDDGKNWELQHTPPADTTIFATGLCQTTSPQAVEDEKFLVVVNCLTDPTVTSGPEAWLYQTVDQGDSWQISKLPGVSMDISASSVIQRQDTIRFQNSNQGWLITRITTPK